MNKEILMAYCGSEKAFCGELEIGMFLFYFLKIFTYLEREEGRERNIDVREKH